MPIHSRFPGARSRVSLDAINDETGLARQQALHELTSGAPKDPSGFDQDGLGENIATLQRAHQQNIDNTIANMHKPMSTVLGGSAVIPREEDLLLNQALYEHNTGKVRGAEGLSTDTEGMGTLPLSLQGLDGADYGYDQFGMPTSVTFGKRPLTKQQQDAQRQAAQPTPWSIG